MTGDRPIQTTTTTLSPQQQQILNLALPAATQFAATTPKAYPGQTVAGFTPVQEQAQSDVLAGAQKAGGIADWSTAGAEALPGTIASSTVPTSSDIFSDPGIWNPDYNTGVRSAIEAAQRPTWQALTETALPAIGGSAITAGGYGGSRQGIAEGLATGRAFQSAQDVASKIATDTYLANLNAANARYATNLGAEVTQRGQTLQDLLAAYGMAPSLQQQQLTKGGAEAAVGDVQQQQKQNEINAEIAKYNFNQMAPAEQAQLLISLLGGIPGGTTTATGNVPTPNPITGALGGAASGAALGSVIPGVGTAVGAGVGGLAGTLPFLFSRA